MMQPVQLGPFHVHPLCFGALPMGPLQKDLTPAAGGEVIRRALEGGVNMIDTAQLYGTYPHIRQALKGWSGEVVIASKSTATDYQGMWEAIQQARVELDRDCIEIFHLHAARATVDVFHQRRGAIEALLEARSRGLIQATGIATHSVKVVEQAGLEDDIDLVFALINRSGLGILEGSREEMAQAITGLEKGVYGMKALGGGNLLGDPAGAIGYVRSILDVVAVGMVSPQEVAANLALFRGEEIPDGLAQNKRLQVLGFLCKGCGHCLGACPNGALSIQDKKAVVSSDHCLLCGYCSPTCPEFALRVI